MSLTDRLQVLELVASAVDEGSRQIKACQVVGVDERTLQRWQTPTNIEDGRQGPITAPRNKLTELEREAILATAARPEFFNRSPHQIVPALADEGQYVGSESSFYRLLKLKDLLAHRGRTKIGQMKKPKSFEATAPRQLFSWDITYLLSQVRGQYFYLYLFLDIFSRKIVGAEVHAAESMEHSSRLLKLICAREGIKDGELTVHADNGGPMKGATMLVTMQWLGVVPSFSRPSVSNDNPFSESMFRTLKFCPIYPTKPFENIEAARAWVIRFVEWYNNEHLHSGISFTTPASRHEGKDTEILKQREVVYASAQKKNPNRWSKATRNWSRIESVKLNWLKDEELSATNDNSRSAS